jgi:hypothetical protein
LAALLVLLVATPAANSAVSGQGAAATETPTATATRQLFSTRVPTPTQFSLAVLQTATLPTDLRGIGLGGIAIDNQGLIYVGDSFTNVYVLSPELAVLRKFKASQPYSLAFSSTGEILIAQRNQAVISAHDRDGKFKRVFWARDKALIETIAVAPDGAVYVIWHDADPPAASAHLTKLSANGNPLYNESLFALVGPDNAAHNISFSRDGRLGIGFSGYALTQSPFFAVYYEYTAEAAIITGEYPLIGASLLTAPVVSARLRDDSFLLFASEALTWWDSERGLRLSVSPNIMRDGAVALAAYARRAAIATRPDGQSVVLAEVRETGELQLAVIALSDLR